jgi:uncharacterized protein YjeT (DUF2065 family)
LDDLVYPNAWRQVYLGGLFDRYDSKRKIYQAYQACPSDQADLDDLVYPNAWRQVELDDLVYPSAWRQVELDDLVYRYESR